MLCTINILWILCYFKHATICFQHSTSFCDFCSQKFLQFSTSTSIKKSFLIVLLIKRKLIPYHRTKEVTHFTVVVISGLSIHLKKISHLDSDDKPCRVVAGKDNEIEQYDGLSLDVVCPLRHCISSTCQYERGRIKKPMGQDERSLTNSHHKQNRFHLHKLIQFTAINNKEGYWEIKAKKVQTSTH